jgi:hypothetical protein
VFEDSKAMAEGILLSKSIEWKYETEYRVLGRDGSLDPKFSIRTEDDYLPLPKNGLRAIIAGCDADLQRIAALINEYAPDVTLKRAVRNGDKYHLLIDG